VSTEKIARWIGIEPSTSTPQNSDCKAGHLNAPKLAGADGGGDDVVGVYGGSGGGPTEGGGIVVEVNEFPSGVSTEITGCDQEPTK